MAGPRFYLGRALPAELPGGVVSSVVDRTGRCPGGVYAVGAGPVQARRQPRRAHMRNARLDPADSSRSCPARWTHASSLACHCGSGAAVACGLERASHLSFARRQTHRTATGRGGPGGDRFSVPMDAAVAAASRYPPSTRPRPSEPPRSPRTRRPRLGRTRAPTT